MNHDDKRGQDHDMTPEHRIAGILVPVFSLRSPGDQGIGDTFGLIDFIDWAAAHGFALVKTLPVNETGDDNSPYNAISSVALDPCLLRLTPAALPDLPEEAFRRIAGDAALPAGRVDYATVKRLKMQLLRAAFTRFLERCAADRALAATFAAFTAENADWLEDYALHQVVAGLHGGSWASWEPALATPQAARQTLFGGSPEQSAKLAGEIVFHKYVQWEAARQWQRVHDHARERGVFLMGDIPFGVNYHSVDVWAERELFLTDWAGGTPPDGFFAHDEFIRKWGQNWGIPLYDWKRMGADGLKWWRRRVRVARRYFDFMRIDHVLGFYRLYGFPWRPERNDEFLPLSLDEIATRTGGRVPHFFPASDEVPADAARNRATGEALLRALLEEAGPHRLVGEDLGFLPPYVRESLESLGMAGYRIPQWERAPSGALVEGAHYPRLALAMYGTHDHDPLKSLWRTMAESSTQGDVNDLAAICHFAGIPAPEDAGFSPALHTALLAALLRSNAWMAIVQIADVFGWEERVNLPGTSTDANWTWRLPRPFAELAEEGTAPHIRELIAASGRAMPPAAG
ncbi:MAG TPA: 4-alpha-glucanotransferase [Burkholderiales bacterium]